MPELDPGDNRLPLFVPQLGKRRFIPVDRLLPNSLVERRGPPTRDVFSKFLRRWVPKIERLTQEAPTTYVYTNNHYRGQSVDTVRQLKLLLEQAGATAR